MSHSSPRRRFGAAILLGLAVLALLPSVALADAEFVRSTPEDGETVSGSPGVIRAFFDEALADGSEMALLDDSGATVAEGTIDPADPTRMRIDPPELSPGDYEVQWKAFAEDGHLLTGTFAFTVSAPITAAPSLSPTPSSEISAPPSESVAPPASEPVAPSPTEGDATPPANAAGTSDVLFPIIAAVVIVAVIGGYLFMRRRPAQP